VHKSANVLNKLPKSLQGVNRRPTLTPRIERKSAAAGIQHPAPGSRCRRRTASEKHSGLRSRMRPQLLNRAVRRWCSARGHRRSRCHGGVAAERSRPRSRSGEQATEAGLDRR
jgi:hypothetical protein